MTNISTRRQCSESAAEAGLHKLGCLNDAVTAKRLGTVDLDLAGRSDRPGIGGPSARPEQP